MNTIATIEFEKDSKKYHRTIIKKDGTTRQDKFRSKLDAKNVYDILSAFRMGENKTDLARRYNVSFRTITCIVEGLMWKDVFLQFHMENE